MAEPSLGKKLKSPLFILLVLWCFCASGCAILNLPGALLGGASKVAGGAINIAKRLPWWMWL
ncbi:MAG: hypothetical protein Q8Q08_06960 [Candidatus Omnitrophota bacterium]|nr:hypothetical protein [Candidatus Omnitrophota bacterium]